MSEEQMEDQTMSSEDKFFGVKTTIGRSQDNEEADSGSDLELEIVDDRPEEDRRAPKVESSADDSDDDSPHCYDS